MVNYSFSRNVYSIYKIGFGVDSMTRQVLIDKIVNMLTEEGTLDIDNYVTRVEQYQDIKKIIEKCLGDFEIIEGKVLV